MELITNRMPEEADGDEDGDVWVKIDSNIGKAFIMHWSMVPSGIAWRPTNPSTDLYWNPISAPDPIPPADPIPAPDPWPLPRLFAAPICRTFTPSNRMMLDAIADDGTAWAAWISAETGPSAIRWHQITPLPQPEAE